MYYTNLYNYSKSADHHTQVTDIIVLLKHAAFTSFCSAHLSRNRAIGENSNTKERVYNPNSVHASKTPQKSTVIARQQNLKSKETNNILLKQIDLTLQLMHLHMHPHCLHINSHYGTKSCAVRHLGMVYVPKNTFTYKS